ncbi:MAG: TonB-dependent receptor [Candidatus Fermentibacteraceae bacterium]
MKALLCAAIMAAAAAPASVLVVTDRRGRPLRATVHTAGGAAVPTDSCGRAELPEEAATVTVAAIGYESWRGELSGDSTVELREAAVPSGVVIPVTADAGGSMRLRAPSTSLVRSRTLSAPHDGIAAELHASSPGIYVRDYGGGMRVLSVSVRGAEAGQTGFSIDGHRFQSPLDGMGPADLDMGMFRGVEVARGGASSAEPGAISGSVNLLTPGPSAPDMLHIWGGSRGAAGLRASAGLGDAGLSIGLRRLEGKGQGLASSALVSGLAGGCRWGGLVRTARGETEPPTWSPLSAGWRSSTGMAGWADLEAGSFELSLDGMGEVTDYRTEFPQETEDTHRQISLGGEGVWNASEWLALGLGAGVEGARSTSIGNRERTSANGRLVLAEDLGPVAVRAEARLDAADDGEVGLSASASASIPVPGTGLSAYCSGARSFRRPTFNDLYWPKDAFAEGNGELQPETALEGELGLAGSWAGASASACGYLASTRDQITWLPEADGVWRPDNVSRVRRAGLELQGELVAGRLGLRGSLTASSAVDRTEGASSCGCRMPYRPDLVGGGWASLDLGPFAVSCRASGRSLSYRNRTQTDYLPGYWLLGAGVSLDLSPGVGLRVDGRNLTDREYEVTDGYPGDPRSVAVMLQWKESE